MLELGADAEPLAQLGVFISYDNKEYPISMRGTNGEIVTTAPLGIDIKTGWHEMKIAFSASNMAPILFKGIEINFTDK